MPKATHDSETPAHGRQVLSATAFIHRTIDGVTKVFLPKRAATKKFLPGVFELPGGHIGYGEDLVAGLKREIDEEFGVAITVGDPFFVFDYTNPVKGSHSIEVIYFATLVGSPEDITIHPEDHSTFDWFAKEDLPKLYSEKKTADDPEFQALVKAFELLEGGRPNFG